MTSPSEPRSPGTEAGTRPIEAIRYRRDLLEKTQRMGTFTADIVADYDALLVMAASGSLDVERLAAAMAAHSADVGFGHSTDSCGPGCASFVLARLAPARNDAGEPG